MDKFRVRFAPSPTGPLHIGGARSALFNYLLARKHGGTFILRIEDTDLERSSRESEQNIMDSLRWLGMDWDEGPDKGGPFGPYRQTERLGTYRSYVDRLLAEGKAYLCYCTEEELAAEREALMTKVELPRYLGRCRSLTQGCRERLEAEGRKPVVRFLVPEDQTVVVEDRVRGQVAFETNGIGDFVIVKSDGIPTYNFAVVIDDATMEITHVIRAEEHLSNTPRQILIYQALGLPLPEFAHISLILGKDRTKMSKRHGSTSVVQYREQGYLPQALVNFLALLGWAPEGEEEIFSMEQLVDRFSLDRVAKNPAVFDMDKLLWLNGYYIRQAPLEEVTRLALPYLQAAGYVGGEVSHVQMEWLKHLVGAVRKGISHLAEIPARTALFFTNELTYSAEAQRVLQEEQVPMVLNTLKEKLAVTPMTEEGVKGMLKTLAKELKLGGKQVYMPIRAALTGEVHGPELFDIIPLLGVEECARRLDSAVALVTGP